MHSIRRSLLACAAALAAGTAVALPVTITTPFMNYENRAINSLGFSTGQVVRFGANSVTPNGSDGTTGLATTTNTVTSTTVTRTINFVPSPVSPNFFERRIAIDPALLGPWSLTFTNGTDSASTTVSLPATASVAPFVNSITLSGTSDAPTFTWTPPPNTTVNGYRINIFDKALINNDPTKGTLNSGNVVSINLQPGVTSYQVRASDFTAIGGAFGLGRNYSIEISLIQTKDGSSSNLSNGNLASIARVYADFTPIQGGTQLVNLPVVLANGSYQFNISVIAGQTYYIDPLVAIGYDYEIGTGDPNFQSVVLPTGIGDGLYDIFGFDALGNAVLLADDWLGGSVFNFGLGGLSRFRVSDIEPGAGLDPANTTAFITGLTFTGNGNFTGTQTPITTFVAAVPEPPVWALLALAGLIGWRRRTLG